MDDIFDVRILGTIENITVTDVSKDFIISEFTFNCTIEFDLGGIDNIVNRDQILPILLILDVDQESTNIEIIGMEVNEDKKIPVPIFWSELRGQVDLFANKRN